MFKPGYKASQIDCGTGNTVIVTGWTEKKTVKTRFQSNADYAAIGQLYSPRRGIDPLLRNLLLNPQVNSLVILDATRQDAIAGGCQALRDFFVHGFDKGINDDTKKPCWVIRSDVPGYIDYEIDRESLELLRQSIELRVCHLVSDVPERVADLRADPQPWGNPRSFPKQEVMPTILPGPRYGHRIEGKTIADTWVKIIHAIKTTGTIRPTGYGGQWQELIDLTAVVTDEPENFYFPEPNFLSCDRGYLADYIPQVLDDAPYTLGVKYTYGQRLRSWFGKDQVKDCINKLIGEIDAASAVMSLWDSGGGDHSQHPGWEDGESDHQHGGSPCLNHIWLRVIDRELSMTALFRSNDMFSAWPSNAFGLRALQMHIREEIRRLSGLDLHLGPLITISQSAHIYSDCWESADRMIKDQYQALVDRRDYADPVGSFVIGIEPGETRPQLQVQRITPGAGSLVASYTGRNPLKLAYEIARDAPALDPAHAIYLGIELQKAYEALSSSSSSTYHQDR